MNRMFLPSLLIAGVVVGLSACGGSGGAADPASPGAQPQPNSKSALLAEGLITGFGSVVVDGQRFATNGTDIQINDAPASESDLQPGMEVRVFGRASDAERIEMHDRLRGPIQAINVEQQQMTVVDTLVQIDEETVFRGTTFDALSVGDLVAVSGLVLPDGGIKASFVGQRSRETDEGTQLRGRIQELDESLLQFQIGRVLVDYSAAELIESEDGLANGDPVVVVGERDTEADRPTLRARQVRELRREPPPTDRPTRIRGIVSEVADNGVFVVRDHRLQVSEETTFRNGSRADLVVGAQVLALGSDPDGNGVIDVRQLGFILPVNGAVEAVVESVDRENRTLTVLGGLTILVPEESGRARPEPSSTDTAARPEPESDRRFSFADVEPATAVRVVGHWNGSLLTARNIHRSQLREERSFIGGELEAVNADRSTVELLGVTIQIGEDTRISPEGDAASFFANAAVGDRAAALGVWDGQALQALIVRHGAGPNRGDRPQRVDRVQTDRANDRVDDSDRGSDAASDGRG